eukprot:COSAG04_NODE_93_length_26686_cov_10.174364_5_plen_53_part_00
MACGPFSTVGQCFSYAAAALYILSMLISLIARVSSAAIIARQGLVGLAVVGA